jgi:hypothetical protein
MLAFWLTHHKELDTRYRWNVDRHSRLSSWHTICLALGGCGGWRPVNLLRNRALTELWTSCRKLRIFRMREFGVHPKLQLGDYSEFDASVGRHLCGLWWLLVGGKKVCVIERVKSSRWRVIGAVPRLPIQTSNSLQWQEESIKKIWAYMKLFVRSVR